MDKIWKYINEVKTPILLFLITKIFLLFVVYFGIVLFVSLRTPYYNAGPFPYNLLLDPWARWDTGLYVNIIKNWYTDLSSAAFLPLYPSLAIALNYFINDAVLSAIVVANISLFFAVIFFYKLIKLRYADEELAERSVFYLLIFPTSFFFSMGHTESTFILMAILTLYYAEQKKWQLAGLFGILAGLTRSTGFLIIVPVLLIYLALIKYDLKKIKTDIIPVLCITLGPLLFVAILFMSGRGPFDYVLANKAWTRNFAFPLWDIYRTAAFVFSYSIDAFLAGNYPVRALASLVLTSSALIISIIAIFKLDMIYGIYSFLSMVFILINPAKEWLLYSDMRYIIAIIPLYIFLAQYGRNKYVNYAFITCFLFFQCIFMLYNAFGGWLQ